MNDELNEEDEVLVENQEDQDESASDDQATESDAQAEESQDQEESQSRDDGDSDSSETQPEADSGETIEAFEPEFDSDILNDYVRRCVAPIEGEHPCGESEEPAASVISQIETTGENIHESLRTSFGEAVRDESLVTFDMSSAGRDADGLVDQIVECLAEKSKSLLLASYLPHLMLIIYGPEGFDAGLTVVRELALRYKGTVFPHDNEKLGGFLRRGVYIGNDDKVTDNYKLFLYLSVTEPGNLPYALLRNARLKGTGGNIEGRYASDAFKTSVDFYVKLIGSLEKTADRAREANSALGELLEDSTFEIVSFQFIESIERMASIVRNLATENCAGYPPVEEEEVSEGAEAGVAAAPVAASGEIVDRDQAIEMLGKIADFFYKTERHSPISYRIRDTVRWCKMDFPELLQLLLDGDQSSLAEMQKRVGFEDPGDSGNSGDSGESSWGE
jgi:type VI secretion system protein ImpA